MIRSLVDIYRQEGWLPDCRMSLCKGWTQGGSNADVLISEAYLKGVADVDWETAYEAVVKDAEVEPPNWNIEGRGGLQSWKTLGYIPIHDTDPGTEGLRTRSISRTVEYAYNDFCIAQMADRMGRTSDRDKYFERSRNWRNLYKDDQTSAINGVDTNFVGFLQPRNADGTWAYQDPIFCSPLMNFTSCYLNADGHETYEGSCWLYTLYGYHLLLRQPLTNTFQLRASRHGSLDTNARGSRRIRFSLGLSPRLGNPLPWRRTSISNSLPIPLRRPPRPISRTRTLVHSIPIQHNSRRHPRKRRQRRNGLIRSTQHDRTLSCPRTRRLPNHRAILQRSEHPQQCDREGCDHPECQFRSILQGHLHTECYA
ncbi:Putative Alpha-1,2-mannosidase [Aspergillus calidoustus]|uniref:Putative Alpha-1,2-mannosidase n=1 Tax=Aspergillus calidoustus TaxID=454130 RepID=A0A0U5GDD6_ASPCI|nr:Putative Alpha-1,2-mannosidase [Aspergillus calidoustus]